MAEGATGRNLEGSKERLGVVEGNDGQTEFSPCEQEIRRSSSERELRAVEMIDRRV